MVDVSRDQQSGLGLSRTASAVAGHIARRLASVRVTSRVYRHVYPAGAGNCSEELLLGHA